jgi:hypothetical protein
MDRATFYTNFAVDDNFSLTHEGVKVGSGIRSFLTAMDRIGPVLHSAGKVLSYNTVSGSRIDIMEHVDQIMTEDNVCHSEEVFSNGFLGLDRPVVMWTNFISDEGCEQEQDGPDALGADGVFQKLLHMGAYPMLPIDDADHSISPTDYLSQPVTMQRCDDTLADQPQQWVHSRSDLLHGSFSSSARSGGVCLTPYDVNISALKPDTTDSRASVWLCCAAGSESTCGSLVNHVYSYTLLNGVNRTTPIVINNPDGATLCLTVLNATTYRTTAVGFEECTGKMSQRWTFNPVGSGELRAVVPSGEEHCLTAPTTRRWFADYAPMLQELYGRSWVLTPHAIGVEPSAGDGTIGPVANLFRVASGFVATVVSLEKSALTALAAVNDTATVTMRGIVAPAEWVQLSALHPGGTWTTLSFQRDGGDLVCAARTVRGCVLIKVSFSKGPLKTDDAQVGSSATTVLYDDETRHLVVMVEPVRLPRCTTTDKQPQLHVLVNARLAASCPAGAATCAVLLPPGASAGAASSVALYGGCGNYTGRMQLLGLHGGPEQLLPPVSTALEAAAARVLLAPVPSRPRVMIYNTVENAPYGTSATASYERTGVPISTIEGIVRSNGTDSCAKQGGGCGVYHATPTINGVPTYYCWYKRRGTTAGTADCKNISAHARHFAQLWHTTGVDVIVPDTTNGARSDDPTVDMINIRPVEVMLEEFAALRVEGLATPQFAVWTTAGVNTTMYEGMLPLVNRREFSELWLTTGSGKSVYFTHSDDDGVIASIRSNSGGDNISTIQMWAIIDKQDAMDGTFTFFQPCQRDSEGYKGCDNAYACNFTTTVRTDKPAYRCNHLLSANKSHDGIGTQMSASMSWQNSQCSMAWAAPSKLMGATFRAQIDDVLRERPDNIMLPSFDEWCAS